ncbi:MAG: hypothetical protein IPJ90_04750 [Anaerolineaceae bacterium]|nr:hypothetical protein [Anaerolineaceae bacterium]
MTNNFTDILDEALEAAKTEPVTAVLHRYPDHAQTLAPLLAAAEQLADWQTVTVETAVPNPNWQTAARAHFLDQIAQLPPAPVSPNPLLRLKGWLTQTRTALQNQNIHKEHKPMNALFARAIATAIVIFGLGGGTAALANNSLPDTPLYPVKLMLEETRLNLADGPAEQASLQTELAQVRLAEMTQLALAGDPISEALMAQLETHLQTALQQAAQTGDPELVGLLTQMQTMLQTEQQTMTQLGDPTLATVNQLLNQYQEQVQAGLADPPMFRWRQGQNQEWEPANGPTDDGNDAGQNGPGQVGPGDGTCLTGDCDPVGDENRFGQTDTSHGSRNQANGNNGNDGPNGSDGTCLTGDCDPVGDANQYGQTDNTNGQHGNGDFDGDGICNNDDCVPAGDENKYGQDDANSGQNGAGDCDNDGTCTNDGVPAGDENQYGQDDANAGQNGDGDFDGDGVCDNDCTPVGDGPQPNPDTGGDNGHGNGG